MISEEIRQFLTEKYGFEVGNFVVIAESKDEEDLNYTIAGGTIKTSGLLSWMNSYVNNNGFAHNYKEEKKKAN